VSESNHRQTNLKDVILVMGSHRKDGQSAFLTKQMNSALIEHGMSPYLVDVNDFHVSDCLDCSVCKNHWAKCYYQDDMDGLLCQLKSAKVLIFATPVYFNGLPSKLKKIVDRFQMVFMCDYSHKKPFVEDIDMAHKRGFIFSVGGANYYEEQFIGNELSLKHVFRNLRFPITEHIRFSDTDKVPLDLREETESSIQRVVDEIVTLLGGGQIE